MAEGRLRVVVVSKGNSDQRKRQQGAERPGTRAVSRSAGLSPASRSTWLCGSAEEVLQGVRDGLSAASEGR